ncbi:MAG: hypothetical protein HFH87_11895 [Lachnospiraceae bacterium]|nr:hypothetical protein [Lachnospiraceae bacterium]
MKIIPFAYEYEYMPVEKRYGILPERNVCSVKPAAEQSDYFYTGNGSHRMDIAGEPYRDKIVVTQELLYEPKWAKTPDVPDLRPYMADIRKYVMEGRPELADKLIDRAQREAGHEKYMNLDAKIVYPMASLHVHKAFHLELTQPVRTGTHNYLRWLDLLTGKVTAHWENECGTYESESLAVYDGDFTATRLTAPKGMLDVKIDFHYPEKRDRFGNPAMEGSTNVLEKSTELFKLAFAYNPEYGQKGYVSVIRFVRQGGSCQVVDDGIQVTGADSLLILSKTVRFEKDFQFVCADQVVESFQQVTPDFESFVASNAERLGGRMRLSGLDLGDPESAGDYVLSGEELLKRCHSANELAPMLMNKLFDMGRFYQIIDTGKLPPMWGQHNINTNLQVCAGNNTGLFEEMDTYFRYYETKFDDFRTNAKRLFGARGLLASVHCDYDSGLYYHFSRTYPHYCWTGCLGWIYNEFWGYYLCTDDKEFLRTRVVPALKEIALFFEDYACDRDERGKVIFYPSFSPEDPTPNPDYMTVTCRSINPTRINSVMDIAICREVLTNLIDACNVLGIEQENIAHWQEQLESLPDYVLDEEGGLKEWAWPAIEENYNHRHVSHHYDLWPGRAVFPDTEPEIAEAIRISNRKRGQQDDSAHGIIHRALCAIRLKDMEELEQNLSQLICHGFVRCNLSTAHFPYRGQFPDLQGAMPAILLEMCVFSRPGGVEFLPALPDDYRTGKIYGIWLYTWAKLKEMEWNEDGVTAKLVSFREQSLTLRCPERATAFEINGKPMTIENNSVVYGFGKGEEVSITIKLQ